MRTRLCGHCGERKTIQGVWYIVPSPDGGPSLAGALGPPPAPVDPAFLCESCFPARGASPPPPSLPPARTWPELDVAGRHGTGLLE